MRIQETPPLHLTYCLNVHPGETWSENFASIQNEAMQVRKRVAPDRWFGLGLRLSCQAAYELARPERLQEFAEFLSSEKIYVFTINAFPYGQFHGTSIKEDVYRPDWTSKQRLEYTTIVADILAALLPDDVSGSISTVPCSYKNWVASDDDLTKIIRNLTEVVAHLARIRKLSGKDICLCLEPEPDCYIENTEEAIAFFLSPMASSVTLHLRKHHGFSNAAAEDILHRHLGICCDTAHMAVQFEDFTESLNQLRAAGVRIGKVQLSSALQIQPTLDALHSLQEFCESTYLHQVRIRSNSGQILSFPDLPQALNAADLMSDPGEQWRIHFHVPLFFSQHESLASTSDLFTPEFMHAITTGITEHLEIETYTFSVLPRILQVAEVTESIAKEYEWVLDNNRRSADNGWF